MTYLTCLRTCLPGIKEDREKRESGYFSLGKTSGSRFQRDKSPPAPFRHSERGHPIFSFRNVEPKDTVPFRNPNLGVASERQTLPLNDDLPVESPPPDPYETSVAVEALVGPRSPSPTPFKIAESLASTGQKGFGSSYGRGNVSSYHQTARFDPSGCGSALQSRASSPSRGNEPFRRSDSSLSLSRRSCDGGVSAGFGQGSRNVSPGTHGQRFQSGTLPRNFKSFANYAQTQSSTISDYRSALRKNEVSRSLSRQGPDSRTSLSSRRDLYPSGQMSSHTSKTTGHDRRSSSPARRTLNSAGSRSPSPQRRTYSSSGLLHKSESILSLSGQSHHGRCGSPIREGYDIESQALLRSSIAGNCLDDQDLESPNLSPTRHNFTSHSVLRKTESSPRSGRQGFGSSSPGGKGYETQRSYQLRKANSIGSLRGQSAERRKSSPPRRSYETPSQSLVHKTKGNSSARIQGNNKTWISREVGDNPNHRTHPKNGKTQSPGRTNHSSRNTSPSRKGDHNPQAFSVLRKVVSEDSGQTFQRKDTPQGSRQEVKQFHRSSSSSRAVSPSRLTPGSGRKAFLNWENPRSPGSVRSALSRHGREERCQSPTADKRPSYRAQSPSPSQHLQMRRHTSSQSSMESSESGQHSLGSSGRNREEYAILADVPKVKIIRQNERSSHVGQVQNHQPPRRQELFKPARSDLCTLAKVLAVLKRCHLSHTDKLFHCFSHSLSRHPSIEWDDLERDWSCGGSGNLSRVNSYTSIQVGRFL